jgi:hypothetical protein
MEDRMRRAFGICVIAVLMLGAIGATSASALPELGRCVAKAGTGKYKNSNCTEKAGSKVAEKAFEFAKNAIKAGFTYAGGEGVFETASGSKYVCTTQSGTGKYDADGTPSSTKGVENVVLKFNGCAVPALGITCNTAGKAAGEIVWNSTMGPFGYISGEKTKTPVVGLELTPEAIKGAFATFECGGGAAKWVIKAASSNCLIAPLSAVNVMSATVEQTYSGAGGVQNPNHFQSTPTKICNLEDSINGGSFERFTWAIKTTLTGEEAVEVKA